MSATPSFSEPTLPPVTPALVTEPPVSPAPALEAVPPVVPLAAAAPTAVPAPAPVAALPAPEPVALASTTHRILVRVDTGEQIAVAAHADPTSARAEATTLMRYLRDGRGDWPFVDGRFIRPDRIVSVDVVETRV